jgi:hypothetical protein
LSWWSIADEPFGSHQSAAIAPKWAASFGSIVFVAVISVASQHPVRRVKAEREAIGELNENSVAQPIEAAQPWPRFTRTN